MMDFKNTPASTDNDSFSRPRSFSDASVSSGRHGYLKKFQEKLDIDRKTSMKVFVRRESHVVSSKDKRQIAEVQPFQILERVNQGTVEPTTKFHSVDNLLSNSNAAQDEVPPPKPALPKNYRLSKLPDFDDKKMQETKYQDKYPEPFAQKGNIDYYNNTVKTDKQSDSVVLNDSKDNSSKIGGTMRHGRNSVSELPIRSSNILYRHFEPKYQSELLKKELDKLRTKEHVRRNSVKQKLESGSRPKSTGDLHVRFADEVNISKEKDVPKSDQNQRTLTRQAKSVTLPSETYHGTNSARYDQHFKQGLNTKPGMADEIRDKSRIDASNNVVKQQAQNSELGRESRSAGILRDRGSVRSKSATIYNRNRNGAEEGLSGRPLNYSQSSLSKSASNLRRKQNTITRFNYGSVEQKRENVRVRYQDSDKRDRLESFSPGLDDVTNVGSDVNVNITSGNIVENVSATRNDRGEVRPTKTVGDNRSDEEKYAELSRQKIFHSKSSSWDSQPSQYTSSSKHLVAQTSGNRLKRQAPVNVKYDRSKLTLKTLTDTSSKTNDGVHDTDRKAKVNSDLPFSDSECYVNKSSNKVNYARSVPKSDLMTVSQLKTPLPETQHGKIVLRQCRVGGDVVFGLVGLQQSKKPAEISDKPNGNGYIDGQGLVTIRMIPDEQGRFGFNVKGGADQGMPIIVSRVAPNTPADNAIPRLNEGDQVLFINGRDVSQHTHEQVVVFIRQSRESRSKELNLIVRPNAYSGDDNSDEPDFVYDPETHQISSATGGANALDLSLKLLEESLESGAALAQFEQLYRKKPGMTMNIARLETNVPKNRYRDISPYDQTRVMIKNGPNGDYINANYVNMEIPVSGILNRYIAAQGPLPTTCIDFWQMIWEQQSTLVVMLTTKVERGRIKCHQYWPNLYETSDHGHLQITCVKEEETASFAFREFNLTNVETQEERHISHMQYIAWPDHGVPDDPADFLDFVQKVRQKRVGLVEPSIVHCSAGIGRTGVLITMETAMCLIEANQPVYPLSIVRQMRDQRAMLIQTPNQYKFVCEAIIRCYNEGIVKPLPEYQQR